MSAQVSIYLCSWVTSNKNNIVVLEVHRIIKKQGISLDIYLHDSFYSKNLNGLSQEKWDIEFLYVKEL